MYEAPIVPLGVPEVQSILCHWARLQQRDPQMKNPVISQEFADQLFITFSKQPDMLTVEQAEYARIFLGEKAPRLVKVLSDFVSGRVSDTLSPHPYDICS